MLITPVKVFTTVHSSFTETNQENQYVITVHKGSPPHILVVRVNKGTDYDRDKSSSSQDGQRIYYTECRYAMPNEVLYIERVEQLIQRCMQGYNSAGVFVNAGDKDFRVERTGMAHGLLDQLKRQLRRENGRRKAEGSSTIKMEYACVGFADGHCYDYLGLQKITNKASLEVAMDAFLQPVEKVDTIRRSIDIIPRNHPTVILLQFTDGRLFRSRLAWIDLLPPSTDRSDYQYSYLEFEQALQQYSDPNYFGIMANHRYSMSHFLLDYFSGCYQTMVFSHFSEYGAYDKESQLPVLEYTSALQNIRCVVHCNQIGDNSQELERRSARIEELEDSVEYQDTLIKTYKEKLLVQVEQVVSLRSRVEAVDFLSKRLELTRSVTSNAMERNKASYEVRMADMEHEMNDLRINLVQTSLSNESYKFTVADLESAVANAQLKNSQLRNQVENDKRYIEELQYELNSAKVLLKTAEDAKAYFKDLLRHYTKTWEEAKSQYRKYITETASNLEDAVDKLKDMKLKQKLLVNDKRTLQLDLESKIAKMERAHDLEMKGLMAESRQQVGLVNSGNFMEQPPAKRPRYSAQSSPTTRRHKRQSKSKEYRREYDNSSSSTDDHGGDLADTGDSVPHNSNRYNNHTRVTDRQSPLDHSLSLREDNNASIDEHALGNVDDSTLDKRQRQSKTDYPSDSLRGNSKGDTNHNTIKGKPSIQVVDIDKTDGNDIDDQQPAMAKEENSPKPTKSDVNTFSPSKNGSSTKPITTIESDIGSAESYLNDIAEYDTNGDEINYKTTKHIVNIDDSDDMEEQRPVVATKEDDSHKHAKIAPKPFAPGRSSNASKPMITTENDIDNAKTNLNDVGQYDTKLPSFILSKSARKPKGKEPLKETDPNDRLEEQNDKSEEGEDEEGFLNVPPRKVVQPPTSPPRSPATALDRTNETEVMIRMLPPKKQKMKSATIRRSPSPVRSSLPSAGMTASTDPIGKRKFDSPSQPADKKVTRSRSTALPSSQQTVSSEALSSIPGLKKKRKLRARPIDDSNMSPILGGFADKYFQPDPS